MMVSKRVVKREHKPGDVVEPTKDESGYEEHPAFGLISASRVTQSPPGATLFDSEIRHQHYVRLTVKRAVRKRDLHHDWIHDRGPDIIEVSMSEAQWASFVSSMNTSGVSCTINRTPDELFVPGLPYAPRMEEAVKETTGAAEQVLAQVRETFEAYAAHKTVGNLRALEFALQGASSNVGYATKTLVEHVENTVQRARADIEAMVVHHAAALGIEPEALKADVTLALETGSDESDG